MNYPLRMCLGEALFLSRGLLFCHDCFPEVRLGRRNAASHRYVYTNIAHRHFRPGQRAQHHQIIEIAQMPEAEQFASNLGEVLRLAPSCSDGMQSRPHPRRRYRVAP